jgi:hypothetical protein
MRRLMIGLLGMGLLAPLTGCVFYATPAPVVYHPAYYGPPDVVVVGGGYYHRGYYH